MKKWYNVELAYRTRKNIERVNDFVFWLQDNGIKYETSGAGNMVHFEVLLDENEVQKANDALDRLVWFDAIVNK